MRLIIGLLVIVGVAKTGFSATACWLDSYGRGVGQIPGRPADCPPGYTNFGLTCTNNLKAIKTPSRLADCPAGYKNAGPLCFRSVFRWLSSNSMSCPDGWFLNKEIGRCYQNCPPTYRSVGEFCMSGLDTLKSDSMSCKPDEIKKGIGDNRCYPKEGECGDGEKDAALCYKKCSPGYKGVGPVCWGQCPSSLPFSCGASCTVDAKGCANTIWGEVSSVGQLAATIATMGTASAVETAVDAPAKASRLQALKDQFDKLKAAFETIKNLPQVTQAIETLEEGKDVILVAKGAKAVASGSIELEETDNITWADIIRVSAQIAAVADSTGVSSIIAAYSLPKCSTQYNQVTAPAPSKKVGYCYADPANPSWFILKAVNKPGWATGDLCHATDGTITEYGQKSCKGGNQSECEALEKSL